MIINILYKLIHKIIKSVRKTKYRILSKNHTAKGSGNRVQPILTNGLGTISIDSTVTIGVENSPCFFNTYCYLEARKSNDSIKIKKNTFINNNACIIAEGAKATIEQNVLIGHNFSLFTSDFHDLAINKRINGIPNSADVLIGKNVFIGSDVTVLKGVTIGENSVIGAGSVVVQSIPENVIAAGNPCKIIKKLKV
ncbi:acyltransferase [Bacillus mobilis]|uniref:acyltransferase n=1 Tax=Bacillus mobilis TaxID=2026190 RepID=UPI0022E1CC18|nr:acyltransferase [Bacillus mobilis]